MGPEISGSRMDVTVALARDPCVGAFGYGNGWGRGSKSPMASNTGGGRPTVAASGAPRVYPVAELGICEERPVSTTLTHMAAVKRRTGGS